MPGVHLEQMLRYCGAATQVLNQTSFFVEGLRAAVEGDIDNHNGGGNLISASPGTIFVEGKKMIAAMMDQGAPDSLGTIIHPFCPTAPAQGSSTFNIFGGLAGGGLGNILGGNLNIGELVSIGSQVIGTVKNFTNNGNGTGNLVLQNMQATPSTGQTIVGQDTGNSFQLINFTKSDIYDGEEYAPNYSFIMNNAIIEETGVIAMPEYFTGLLSQDYQTENIITL